MNKREFVDLVRKILEDYEVDDRVLSVEDFLESLVSTIEYETGFEFEEEDEQYEYEEDRE
jgi:hypothetical protein